MILICLCLTLLSVIRKSEKFHCLLEKKIFRSGKLVRDENREMFAATALAYDQRSLVLVAFASGALLCPENHCTEDKP